MCLTLVSPEADPETRIYEEWVYYKGFSRRLSRTGKGVEGLKEEGRRQMVSLAFSILI